jgi:hypothetical protein
MSDTKFITVEISPTTATKNTTYPWAHLFNTDEAELIDYEEAHLLSTKLGMQKEELASKTATLNNLKTISSTTFDEMKEQIIELKQRLADKEDKEDLFDVMKEKLVLREEEIYNLNEKIENVPISPFQSAIITQSIIAHSKKLSGESAHAKILQGVLRWLQQRRKVIQYLSEHSLRPDLKEKLEAILFIEQEQIDIKINKLDLALSI